jgi:hypothetical protein
LGPMNTVKILSCLRPERISPVELPNVQVSEGLLRRATQGAVKSITKACMIKITFQKTEIRKKSRMFPVTFAGYSG